ncbi:MAG: group III truncated hemoglobin [Allomuricauda sp.]|nr:MAG: group III truncated hemoglobin [Allomuricauda sp.]
MKEISGRLDIELLVDRFYEKVISDDVIGFFFNDVIRLDWKVHIPIMYDFWESLLFGLAKYHGNPMLKHISLNKKEEIKSEHFSRWLELWEQTIHENFHGNLADEAINKAVQIGDLMKFKVAQLNSKN